MSRVEELKKKAEAFWEACHGCNESDRDMWINFYIKGALANQIQLPTDDEIELWAKEQAKIEPTGAEEFGRIWGAKWMRDKIQGGGDE